LNTGFVLAPQETYCHLYSFYSLKTLNQTAMSKLLLLLFAFPFIANSQITTYNSGQAFTCIAVDSNYNVWAGTSKAGLYLLNKKDNPAARQFNIASSGSLVPITYKHLLPIHHSIYDLPKLVYIPKFHFLLIAVPGVICNEGKTILMKGTVVLIR
jgi:hypothetical protein